LTPLTSKQDSRGTNADFTVSFILHIVPKPVANTPFRTTAAGDPADPAAMAMVVRVVRVAKAAKEVMAVMAVAAERKYSLALMFI
jgi:hypothetical protein